MSDKKCWLCLRITPQQIAKAIHEIFPEELHHEILVDATSYIEKAYKKNPILFCGKSSGRIIGGLLYLLGFKYGYKVTQHNIAKKVLSLSEGDWAFEYTVGNGVKDWRTLFPEDFPPFDYRRTKHR